MGRGGRAITIDELERRARLETLAKCSYQSLSELTLYDLHKFAKGLIPSYTKIRKDNLVKQLYTISDGFRTARQSQRLDNVTPAQVDARIARRVLTRPSSNKERSVRIFERLESAARSSRNLEVLQKEVMCIVVQQVSLEGALFSSTTRKFNKTEVLKNLNILLDGKKGSIVYDNLKVALGIFEDLYHAAFKSEASTIRNAYREQVAEQGNNLIPVNVSAMLNRAIVALLELSDWREVSIALALLTGRRMAEIHSSGVFSTEGLGDLHIEFKGQLKARHDASVIGTPFVIPVLARHDLIVQGIEYLEKMGKRISEPALVNDIFSRALNRAMEPWCALGGTKLTYKDLRCLYGTYALRHLYDGSKSPNAFLAALFGHGENDVSTANSYQKFKLADVEFANNI